MQEQPKVGDHAVWIVKGGNWVLHMNYRSAKIAAGDERDYLRKAEVVAEVFVKQ